jgi:hypothetical protein
VPRHFTGHHQILEEEFIVSVTGRTRSEKQKVS